jgi:hypothetical protein
VRAPQKTALPFLPTLSDIDAAKRIADAVNLVVAAEGLWTVKGRWMAFRLADGSTDRIHYPTKADCRRHQTHPELCFYVSLTPDGMKEDSALRLLHFNRRAKTNGYDLSADVNPATIINNR